MDPARVLELQRRAIEAWIPTLVHASPGAEMLALNGVIAAVLPACPQRSLVNGAIYEDVRGLRAALPELAAAYERAGVRASTVWVLEPNREATTLLEEAGYVYDGEPAGMVVELVDLGEPDLGDLDWDSDASPEEVGRVNDLAYGYPEGEGVSPAIGAPPQFVEVRSYRARLAGVIACVLQTIDVGSDCMISWVATVPEHRGRMLASRLLGAALVEARDRGLRTSSLQASMLGRGVYERLGYTLGLRLQLYERRLSSTP